VSDYTRFFRRSTVVSVEPAVEQESVLAEEIVAFGALPYFAKFVAWLDAEAFRPLKIGNQLDMVQAAVRANTLREIREHLVKEIARARATLEAGRES